MAAYRLIGQDAAVQLKVSTNVADGTAPVYGAFAGYLGIAKTISYKDSLDTVDVAAIGDRRSKYRAKRARTEISLDKFVLSTGVDFGPTGPGVSFIGYYAQMQFKELSTLTTYKGPAEGIITEWTWSTSDAEQVEHITIMCDAEHA